ncbi:MAG: diguanylate cyclase [Rhizobiales bacterium]|nr:diguanylate cyclase [Hyphomicrobiales bacterium]
MITRRNVLHGSLLATAGAAVGRINPDFFFTSAHAQEGRTMRFLGAEALTGNWDPTTHTNLGQLIVEGFVFGYLTRAPMSPDNPEELIYELATEMNSVDEYTLEVKLREGVKFHDGTPFTAADVKATYEYGCQPDRPAQWYPGQVKVEVIDDLTCHIKTEEFGYPAALYIYLSSFLPIMAAKDVENKAQLSARMNGTGPMKFVEQQGDSTFLEANADFLGGAPKIPGVEYRFVGDTTTRTLSLLNGEADIIERLEAEQVDTIAADDRFTISKALSVENKYLFFRCSKAPFDNPLVRQAAAHAIDREGILEILGVSGAFSKAHISPVKFGYTEVENYREYDPEKCQELLAEAGFPGGEGLPELTYYTSVGFYPKTKEYAEYIAALLQEQGFKINLQTLEVAAWGNLLYDKEGGGEGNMIDCGWCTGSPEPDLVLRTHFHSSSKRITGIVDPEIDAVLDKERNAKTIDERRKILQEEPLPMIADKVPAHALFTSVFIHAYTKELEGLYIYPNGMQDVTDATLG